MNSLNSILIEGNMVTAPVLAETPDGLVCTFKIRSYGHYARGMALTEEISIFAVEVYDQNAMTCSTAKVGQGVRVVGRIQQRIEGMMCIIAEHVAVKPRGANKKEMVEKLSLKSCYLPQRRDNHMKQFICSSCGGKHIEEVLTDVIVTTLIQDVRIIDGELEFEYGCEGSNDGGVVDRYQCVTCGSIVSDDALRALCDEEIESDE